MKRLISAFLAVLLLAPAFPAAADELVPPDATVIVQLTDSSAGAIADVENIPGITVTDILLDNVIIVAASTTASEAIDTLTDLPQVEYAEPSVDRLPFTIPTSDSLRTELWGLDNTGQNVHGTAGTSGDDIDAVRAWNLSYGTSTVVAVIDSGVLYTHPDLSASMWDGTNCVDDQGVALGNCIHGYDFKDDDLDPMPVSTSTSFAHGTHVAGTIAAEGNNGIGIVGVAPSAKIMALRFDFDTASEIRAINFARQNGVKIINASYGGTSESIPERNAIQAFTDAGGLFIAAAGNGSGNSDISETAVYPAAYDIPGIISVAGTDQNDALASFSNYGLTSVDLGAPGVNILSTYMTGTSTAAYAYADGTSMSAPHVAGIVALVESLYPALSSTDVKSAVLAGGDLNTSLTNKSVSGRRANAYVALRAAGGEDITPPVITLTGASSVSLTVGSVYTELGATAYDTHDGTTTVTIGGSVNTATAGTYQVTYDATDSAGNAAVQVVRTVTVTAVVSSGGGGGGGGGGSKSSSRKVKKTTTVPKPSVTVPRPALPAVAGTSTAPGPVGAPVFSFSRTLALGLMGADVTALQQALTRAGVYTGPITGYFGPLTRAGVLAYQAKHGLAQVGLVGPMTRALLNQGL